MSSMLGMAAEADTDMTSSYDFEFTAPIASDAMGEDFDIDLTFEHQDEQLDAVMVDSDENNDPLETEMHDTFLDEPMFENLESAQLELVEIGELDILTPRATSPEKVADVLTSTDEVVEPVLAAKVQESENSEGENHDRNTETKNINGSETVQHDTESGDTVGNLEEHYEEDTGHTVDGYFDADGVDEANQLVDNYEGDGVNDETTQEQEDLLQEFDDEDEEHVEAEDEPIFTTVPNLDTDSSSDQEETSLKYHATVSWNGYWVSLFPDPSIESEASTAFSEDVSILEKDLNTFFKTGRQVLKSSIPENHVLEMEVPQLELKLDEDSHDCAEGSLLQMLQLYYRLHANDGVDDPEPMEIVFTSSLRYSARIGQLFEAAEASKGYAELLGHTDDDPDNSEADELPQNISHDGPDHGNGKSGDAEAHVKDEDHGHVADEHYQEPEEEYESHGDAQEYEAHEDDHDYSAHGEKYEAHDEYGEQNDAQEAVPELVNEEDESGEPVDDESEVHEDTFEAQQHTTGVAVKTDIAKETTQPAMSSTPTKDKSILDEEDEIDYTDTEDSVRTKTPKSKQKQASESERDKESGDHQVAASNTAKSNGEHDFEIDIYGNDQVDDSPIKGRKEPLHQDTDEPNPPLTPQLEATGTGSGTNTAALKNDAEFELELERSFSEEGPSPSSTLKPASLTRKSPDVEEEIDWDEDENDAPEAGVGSGPKGGSPLGKRNREDHLEEQAEVDNGQEAKRVKS